MPINFLATVLTHGTSAIPYYKELQVWVPMILVTASIKWFFTGSRNTWQRDLHGKVVLITGGTSGVGAVTVRELASRGAQVILLVRNLHDGWLNDYISDLRESTENPCIYAEECNLGDFYSVRKFATTWLDNITPRRLDMVICCAAVAQPPSVPRVSSKDGIEIHIQTNYLSHFHLLTLLTPALSAQPPDREVRVILITCISSVMGQITLDDLSMDLMSYNLWLPHRILGTSKLALSLFGYDLQRRLRERKRKDGAPNNVHVAIVDPGMMRSPSFKRFVSLGRVIGLLIYLLLWPIWFIFLKSSADGAQSILFAIMNPAIADTQEVSYISDCRIRNAPPRKEFKDVEFQKELSKKSSEIVLSAEKASLAEQKRRGERSQLRTQKGPRTSGVPKSPADLLQERLKRTMATETKA